MGFVSPAVCLNLGMRSLSVKRDISFRFDDIVLNALRAEIINEFGVNAGRLTLGQHKEAAGKRICTGFYSCFARSDIVERYHLDSAVHEAHGIKSDGVFGFSDSLLNER